MRGREGASLSRMAEACLGKPLDKSMQLSSWAARPLSQRQLTYAGAGAAPYRTSCLTLLDHRAPLLKVLDHHKTACQRWWQQGHYGVEPARTAETTFEHGQSGPAGLDALAAVLIFDKMEERDGDRFRRQVRGALSPMGLQPARGKRASLHHAAGEGGTAKGVASAGEGVLPARALQCALLIGDHGCCLTMRSAQAVLCADCVQSDWQGVTPWQPVL